MEKYDPSLHIHIRFSGIATCPDQANNANEITKKSNTDWVVHDDVIKWKLFRVTAPLWGEPTGHRWILTGGFPSQRPVTRNFDVFFDLHLNKLLSKQSRRRWYETPSRSLCIALQIGENPVQFRYPQSIFILANHTSRKHVSYPTYSPTATRLYDSLSFPQTFVMIRSPCAPPTHPRCIWKRQMLFYILFVDSIRNNWCLLHTLQPRFPTKTPFSLVCHATWYTLMQRASLCYTLRINKLQEPIHGYHLIRPKCVFTLYLLIHLREYEIYGLNAIRDQDLMTNRNVAYRFKLRSKISKFLTICMCK